MFPMPNTPPTRLSRRTLLAQAASIGCATLPLLAAAEAKYPTKPIRVVVPFGAGGGTDVIARVWGERITRLTSQPVVIENRVGASGIIGTQVVANAPPDGYNLLYTSVSMSINPLVYDKLPYKTEEFIPVIRLCAVPFVIIVSANSKIKTLQDLVATAKASPGRVSFGHYGVGQLSQIALALLMNMAGISMLQVPYKSVGDAIGDLVGDRLDVAIDASSTTIPQVKSGRLRALAITGQQRIEGLPGIPTVAELFPGFAGSSWHGIFAPRGTPQEVVAKLSELSQQIVSSPDFRGTLRDAGLLAAGGTQADFQKFLADENRLWSKVVKDNNIRVE